jgi:hypothetical protein
MLFGKSAIRPLKVLLDMDKDDDGSEQEYHTKIVQSLREAHQQARETQTKAALSRLKYRNRRQHQVEYSPDTFVYVWIKNRPSRFDMLWKGPYRVIKKLDDLHYVVNVNEQAEGSAGHTSFHVSLLKPYLPFADNIDDTSPSVKGQTVEEFKVDMSVGSFVIVPASVWPVLQFEGLPFCVGEILKVDGQKLTIRRYGNYQGMVTSVLKPGWIDCRLYGRKTPPYRHYFSEKPNAGGSTQIPYTNYTPLGSVSLSVSDIPMSGICLEQGKLSSATLSDISNLDCISWYYQS